MSLAVVLRGAATSRDRDRDRERARTHLEEEEFRAFYERTARPLWAYLSRVSGSPQEADDVLQEAFYRFYRAGDVHADEAHRRNSLFRIATNIVRDSARRAGHRRHVSLDEPGAADSPAGLRVACPDREIVARSDLARALGQLEPSQRQMLWLAYAQGASHREIAEIVGVRAVSVRTMLLRARRKIAAILASDVGPGGARREP